MKCFYETNCCGLSPFVVVFCVKTVKESAFGVDYEGIDVRVVYVFRVPFAQLDIRCPNFI
jgi:hypothetical protein